MEAENGDPPRVTRHARKYQATQAGSPHLGDGTAVLSFSAVHRGRTLIPRTPFGASFRVAGNSLGPSAHIERDGSTVR